MKDSNPRISDSQESLKKLAQDLHQPPQDPEPLTHESPDASLSSTEAESSALHLAAKTLSASDTDSHDTIEQRAVRRKVRCGNCRNIILISITEPVRIECAECGHINPVCYTQSASRRNVLFAAAGLVVVAAVTLGLLYLNR